MVLTTERAAPADPPLVADALPAWFPPAACPPPAPQPARATSKSKQPQQAKYRLNPMVGVSYVRVTGCAYRRTPAAPSCNRGVIRTSCLLGFGCPKEATRSVGAKPKYEHLRRYRLRDIPLLSTRVNSVPMRRLHFGEFCFYDIRE